MENNLGGGGFTSPENKKIFSLPDVVLQIFTVCFWVKGGFVEEKYCANSVSILEMKRTNL